MQLGLEALRVANKPHRVPAFVRLACQAVPELKSSVLDLLDYTDRREHHRSSAPFLGTDSFDDLA